MKLYRINKLSKLGGIVLKKKGRARCIWQRCSSKSG
jgi:hypothetical protein